MTHMSIRMELLEFLIMPCFPPTILYLGSPWTVFDLDQRLITSSWMPVMMPEGQALSILCE